jgi:hypothetical protein
MATNLDLVWHTSGEFAYTHQAEARMVQAHIDKQEVIRQHVSGRWDTYQGETHQDALGDGSGYRMSFCFTSPNTCVLVGERAGILMICCPDDFANFIPPLGGPH